MSPMFKAAILIVCAAILIPLGDTVAKYAAAQIDVPMTFFAWSRFAIGAAVFAPFALKRGVTLRQMTPPVVLLRGVMIAGGVALILQAAQRAPIANVYGAFFIAPVISVILAMLFLKERPGLKRIGLSIIGFIGVMFVVQPTGGISTGMLFGLAAGCFYGGFLAVNRASATGHDPVAMLWSQLIVAAVLLTPVGFSINLTLGWFGIAAVMISAVASALANFLMILAYRQAEASSLAPLVYTQLIGATIYGVIFFGDFPDTIALFGIALILLSGLAALAMNRKHS